MANYTGTVKSFLLQVAPANSGRKSFGLQRGTKLYTTGGIGRVRGTVLVTPDLPVARMVYLYTETDHLLFRMQLSAPVTGAFDFLYVPMGQTYMAVAIDHTGVYRAETHDGLAPELMP